MTDAAQYRAALAALKLTQQQAADLLRVSLRASQGYATGQPIPGPVAELLTLYLTLGTTDRAAISRAGQRLKAEAATAPVDGNPAHGKKGPMAEIFTAHGKSQTLDQWATDLGLPRRTIESRLRQYGWTVEQALTPGRAKSGPRRPGADAPAMTARPAPPRQSRARYEDIAGRKYGHLTPVTYAGDKSWHCRCACGQVVTVPKTNLRSGRTKSCGCGGAGPATS